MVHVQPHPEPNGWILILNCSDLIVDPVLTHVLKCEANEYI